MKRADKKPHVAYHEAGHAVAAHVQRYTTPGMVTIIPDAKTLGRAEIKSHWDRGSLREVTEQTVICDFAGTAAESFYESTLGGPHEDAWHSGGSWIESPDWRSIRRILRCACPDFRDIPDRPVGGRTLVQDADRRRRVKLFDSVILDLKRRTSHLVRRNWAAIDSVAKRLIEAKTLSGEDLAKYLIELDALTDAPAKKTKKKAIKKKTIAKQKRKPMSAEAKKALSARMTKYWAARRKAAGRNLNPLHVHR